ncbi:LysM peptidoglycan-binding domain-containing protein [Mesobacillus subterraneus]|uniref:LysM peptidoglycan-binding domain-containing protein n=1 Tax=Mesobacillus subterraneus TaxID=285983 RepID=UPI0020412CEF|nr:LysM peptidoglycan-binding domain-containing protein [Mesobacillus subterraneus]MCM3666704.1 LysM peptidoglycan-binding domain-containing protein [Mesobacillus subterraneus]MCM3685601.1 LysM peptidoglycan-binding domain-containing protein [Mesobacillus subterraneus]
MIIHVVQRGESLWQISSRYQVTISQVTNLNALENPNQLVVGQALLIPSYDAFHTVRSGEALWSIAQRYGTSADAIVRVNGITNPALIYPGTVLKIPAIRHTVQPGEALWQIARRYSVTVQSIIRANQIQNPNVLYPGTILVIPRPKPTIESNAFTYHSDEKAVELVREVAELMTYIAPFAYVIQPDGSLVLYMKDDTDAIQTGLAKGALPMMSITNFTTTQTGENIAHEVLASDEHRSNLLNNILSVMREKGYRGLNIDFENVLPADRELYNTFLQESVNTLHKEGYFVSTSLAPKITADQKGLLYEAHDYPAHGRIADFVVLMTYEWGYRFGPPRAVSPLNEIRRVLDYAITAIPRNKILMGFQLYARDWVIPHVQGQEAETYSPQEAVNRAIKYGAAIQYDTVAASPFFRYTDEQGREHEVWFEDARSAQAKFDLIKQYNLRGVSYWVLGYPFPQNWALLEDNFNIKKLT